MHLVLIIIFNSSFYRCKTDKSKMLIFHLEILKLKEIIIFFVSEWKIFIRKKKGFFFSGKIFQHLKIIYLIWTPFILPLHQIKIFFKRLKKKILKIKYLRTIKVQEFKIMRGQICVFLNLKQTAAGFKILFI